MSAKAANDDTQSDGIQANSSAPPAPGSFADTTKRSSIGGKKIVAIGIGAAALLILALIFIAGRGGGSPALVISGFDGSVLTTDLSPEGQLESTSLFGVNQRIAVWDQATGQDYNTWVATVGSNLYAITGFGDFSSLTRTRVGSEDDSILFEGRTGSFTATLMAASESILITETTDDFGQRCYVVRGEERATEVAAADACLFSQDGTRVVEVRYGNDFVDLVQYTVDTGETVGSFVMRNVAPDAFEFSDNLSSVGYIVSADEESTKIGYFADFTGQVIGETDPMRYLSVSSDGDGLIFNGDTDGTARFWAGNGQEFALVGEGSSGSVALSANGEGAIAVTIRDGVATISEVSFAGEAKELTDPFPTGDAVRVARTQDELLVTPTDGRPLLVIVDLNGISVERLEPEGVSGVAQWAIPAPSGWLVSYGPSQNGSVNDSLLPEEEANLSMASGTVDEATYFLARDDNSTSRLVTGSVFPYGVIDNNFLYASNDSLSIVEINGEERPRRLLNAQPVGPLFVRGTDLFTTVEPTGDSFSDFGFPIGDVVSASLRDSQRSQLLEPFALLVSVPDATQELPGASARFSESYDPQSLTREETIQQATGSFGCTAIEEFNSSLDISVEQPTCFTTLVTGSLTLTVNSVDSAQAAYATAAAIAFNGERVGEIYVPTTERCVETGFFGFGCSRYEYEATSASLEATSEAIGFVIYTPGRSSLRIAVSGTTT